MLRSVCWLVGWLVGWLVVIESWYQQRKVTEVYKVAEKASDRSD